MFRVVIFIICNNLIIVGILFVDVNLENYGGKNIDLV